MAGCGETVVGGVLVFDGTECERVQGLVSKDAGVRMLRNEAKQTAPLSFPITTKILCTKTQNVIFPTFSLYLSAY